MYDNDSEGQASRGEVERRREPFVPNPNRVVYPVDLATSQRYALEKFEAATRIVVGGQLTRRMVREACDLEDEIRSRVHDDAQYEIVSVALGTYLADAIQVRHNFMNPDNDAPRNRQ